MKNKLSANATIFILHFSFWVLYVTYRVYDVQEYLGLQKAVVYIMVPLCFSLTASYIHYFFILPQWLRDKKHLPYFIKLLVVLLIVILLRIITENEVFAMLATNTDYYQTVKIARIISTLWDTLGFIVFTGMIRFTVNWFVLENRKKQLENEKLIAELNYLKAQINPHFLFNTLHNLNYLVYSGAKTATEVIIKLSNIMRYMIYDAAKTEVPLQKEIEYMNDYIALESIRLNKAFDLQFNIHGDAGNTLIAPLVLITFLENAFKHGVSDGESGCWIKADIFIEDHEIRFAVSNRKLKAARERLKSGFGLDNVKKRLELIYPNRHSIRTEEDEQTYKVNIRISR